MILAWLAGADAAKGFVEDIVNLFLEVDEVPIDRDLIDKGVDHGLWYIGYRAIDLDPSIEDDRLRCSPRGNAGCC